MKLEDVKIGTRFEIFEYNKDHILNDTILVSNFEKLRDDGCIIATCPIVKGTFYTIISGTFVKINFINRDMVFCFKGKIIERIRAGNFAYIIIEKIGAIEKIQRRNFYRFNYITTVNYKIDSEDQFKKAYTSNVSAGGLCIKCNERLDLNSNVELEFSLDKIDLKYKGKIVRCEKTSNKNYNIGIQFIEITEKERKCILDFVYKEQVKLRQKGVF